MLDHAWEIAVAIPNQMPYANSIGSGSSTTWWIGNHWKLDEIKADGGPRMTAVGTATKVLLLLSLFAASFFLSWHHFHLLHLNDSPSARLHATVMDVPALQGYTILTELKYPLYAWLVFFLFFGGSFLTQKGLALIGPICAVVEGIGFGAFEYVLQVQYPGITVTCGMVVIGMFIGLFLVYWFGFTATDNVIALYIAGAAGGLIFVYIATFVLKSFAVDVPFLHEKPAAWNGAILAFLLLGCGVMVSTFGEIQKAIDAGAPRWVEWRAALCLFGSFVLLLRLFRRLLLNRSAVRVICDSLFDTVSRSKG